MSRLLIIIFLFSLTTSRAQEWHFIDNIPGLTLVSAHGYGTGVTYVQNNQNSTESFLTKYQYDFKDVSFLRSTSSLRDSFMQVVANPTSQTILYSVSFWSLSGQTGGDLYITYDGGISSHYLGGVSPINQISYQYCFDQDYCFNFDQYFFQFIRKGKMKTMKSFSNTTSSSDTIPVPYKDNISFTSPDTGFLIFQDSIGRMVGKTSDTGLTWNYTRLDSNHSSWSIDFLDKKNGIILSNGNNIFRTNDAGLTWTFTKTNLPDTVTFFGLANNGNSYYLRSTTTNKIWKSIDTGKTWIYIPVDKNDVKGVVSLTCPQWDRCYVIDDDQNVYMNGIITDIVEVNDPEITIIPNPVINECHINATGYFSDYDVHIYNSSGKLVFSGKNIDTIDMSGMDSGIYFLNVRNSNQVFTKKVIKL